MNWKTGVQYYLKHPRIAIFFYSSKSAHFAKYYIFDIYSNSLDKSIPRIKTKKNTTGL